MSDQPIPRPEVVSGDRIYLTTLRKDDVALFVQWFNNLEYTTYLGSAGFAATHEDEEAWYESASKKSDNKLNMVIVERETGQAVGTISLMEIDHRHSHATLGIGIGSPQHQGRGYGSEAVRLMVEFGFFFLNLHSIMLWHIDFNQRGHRAYLKAGFREVGRVRKSYSLGGQRYDNVLMDITRDDVDLSRMRSMITLLSEDRN